LQLAQLTLNRVDLFLHRTILLGLCTVLLNLLVFVSGILLTHRLDFPFQSSYTFLGLLRHQGGFDDLILK
jgi:hypothetical protein